MSLIELKNLRREFRVIKKQPGRFTTLRNLISPKYEQKLAVDDVSMSIESGEMVGFVGPNGAGKSTTIKMLTGILMPTAGEVNVAGFVPHRDRERYVREIGAVFGQKSQLWWDMPVIESMRLLKDIYEIPEARYEANLKTFRDLLDMREFENTPVRQLSLGQRMRSDLAAALLHDPKILFLDEPTIGVDVLAKERFRSIVTTLNRERSVTVLLTTHDIADIERLCNRIIVIDKGRLLFDGALADMRNRFLPYSVLVVDLAENVGEVRLNCAELIQREQKKAHFRFNRLETSAAELITELVQQVAINDISIEEPSIESIVRDIYEHGVKREG
jgi:ABC-2 type transport system ATP-binding protein